MKDTQEKIGQLQLMEQNLNNFLAQRQKFQAQLIEMDNAIEELGKTKGKSYRIIGNIMVDTPREEMKGSLESKKKIVELRIRSIEKQENEIEERAKELQKEILKEIEREKKDD